MSDLFIRDATVTAGRVKIPIRSKGDAITTAPDVIKSILPALRITFSVEKSAAKKPNIASLTIYNLNETHRKGMAKGQPLIIEAGYIGTVSQIFSGEITKVEHKKEETDWVTTVESGDGASALRGSRIAISYAPGTDRKKVIMDLAKQMKLGAGNVLQKMSEVQLRKALTNFTNGFVASGAIKDVMDKVVGSAGFQWSVQDGQVQLLEPHGTTIETVVKLNYASGMIGSPEFGEGPGAKKSKPTVKVKSLLQGAIRPGRRIVIESSTVNGTFRCEKVTHTGDSFGQEWYTEVEGVAV